MEKLVATVKFYETRISLEDHQGEVTKTKNISATSLSQAFAQNVMFDTGLMPTVHGVVRYVEKNNYVIMSVQVPARKRDLKYRDESCNADYKGLPMPWVVFTFIYRKNGDGTYNKLREYAFALKGPILTLDHPMYKMPFTNMHPDGEICWGGHHNVTRYNNLAGVASIPETFFATPFNNHLEGGHFHPTKFVVHGREATVITVSTLLNALQGMEEFPHQVLIKEPKNYGVWFSDLVNNV